MTTPISNSEEVDLKGDPLTPSFPSASSWTTVLPTVPGWYWLRHAVFHGKAGAWHEPYEIIVEVIQSSKRSFSLCVPGTDRIWDLEDLVVAEWAGPLFPPV